MKTQTEDNHGHRRNYWESIAAIRLLEIQRLEKLLADADLCAVCGLDYAGYADYDEACKCDEGVKQ